MNHIRISAHAGSLNLQVEAGFANKFILVSGENGAGKTTLLRCLAGLETSSGLVQLNGTVWLDSEAGFVLPAEQRHTGCVWADAVLLPWLSVEQNMLFGSVSVDHGWLEWLSEKLEIAALMQRKPHMLSTGEQQRVALARALYRKPGVLLLDEPFSAQAPAIRQRLREVLKSLQVELDIPVIMVSHDADDATALASQHWHMREGRLLLGVQSHQQAAQQGKV